MLLFTPSASLFFLSMFRHTTTVIYRLLHCPVCIPKSTFTQHCSHPYILDLSLPAPPSPIHLCIDLNFGISLHLDSNPHNRLRYSNLIQCLSGWLTVFGIFAPGSTSTCSQLFPHTYLATTTTNNPSPFAPSSVPIPSFPRPRFRLRWNTSCFPPGSGQYIHLSSSTHLRLRYQSDTTFPQLVLDDRSVFRPHSHLFHALPVCSSFSDLALLYV